MNVKYGLVTAAIAIVAGSTTPAKCDVIKVGVIGTMSGPYALFGQNFKYGIDAWVSTSRRLPRLGLPLLGVSLVLVLTGLAESAHNQRVSAASAWRCSEGPPYDHGRGGLAV